MRLPRARHRLSAAGALVVILGLSTATALSAGAADAGSVAGPRNGRAPSITGVSVKGRILAAHNGSWSGTGPITYTVRWLRCDGNGAGCSQIRGATASTHMLTSSDVGFRIRLRVTAADSGGATRAGARGAPTETPPPPPGRADSAPPHPQTPAAGGGAAAGGA